jgi:hypothetical protein
MRVGRFEINQILVRAAFFVALTIAVVMALLPHPPHLPIDDLGDKFEHSLAFVVLTVLATASWPDCRLWLIGEHLSFLGAWIEVTQSIPVLHRDCDILDWITDSIAIIVTLIIVATVRRYLGTNSKFASTRR